MPEGDAIVKDARRLRPVLVGREALTVECRWPRVVAGLTGTTVTRLTTHGKHLLLHFDVGIVLRVHRQMTGFWRSGPRRMDADQRLAITTEAGRVALYDAPTVERIDVRALPEHPVLSGLGPDVLHEGFDPEEAVRRAPAEAPVGLVLLDQRVAAGPGNVFRAETLFYERVDPFMSFREVEDPTRLWVRVRVLMLQNLEHPGTAIRTRAGVPWNYVYGRARKPCLRCRTRVKAGKLGGTGRGGHEQLTRTVYWCPRCQR